MVKWYVSVRAIGDPWHLTEVENRTDKHISLFEIKIKSNKIKLKLHICTGH